ncbi:dihydrodipicolinate synthase family protein [Arthrobacter sp. FW305-BF8]|uniref:dihydrodipicolinate synthase family protein n=1 Tax=Arthrobacter sp. FW305-BF8 TaxID=2879617 RepID=UPI001F27317A|nr:dihydrodipicolinate synthase family protein [Arthrobacter sp. FW305-BF8]UKA54308.1 dihydrodipicolinate synthase family protein [Arthrobacter sp. FW305-BF8]
MFEGLCAFPLTPLAGDNVDKAALVGLVGRCVDAGADSIGVLGSTGIYTYLLREERRKVVEAAVEAAQGTPVVAGVGAMRTRDVLDCVEDAQSAGASGLLLAPVSYQRLTEEEVYGLYREVSSASELPIAVYDNPATTGFTFSDELHGRIAELPGIASIKFPPPAPGQAADRVARLRAAVPGGISLGISGDWAAAEALLAGCDVWYSVIAGLFPKTARQIVDLAQTGETAETGDGAPALEASAALELVWALFRTYGSLRVAATMAEVLGFVEAPCLPRPLQSLDAEGRTKVEEALRLSGLGA